MFGADIGSDLKKKKCISSPIYYMKNIHVSSSCKFIFPHYYLYVYN